MFFKCWIHRTVFLANLYHLLANFTELFHNKMLNTAIELLHQPRCINEISVIGTKKLIDEH
jgi:hypothetical protein